MNQKTKQVCTRCIMDSSVPNIRFDAQGICNYCTDFLDRCAHVLDDSSEIKAKKLKALVDEVKHGGQGKRYDCIVGVSGGVDSSWVLVRAVELGLRPLAVHMDNGWNSELAQNNIANLVQKLGVDLYTHVIDWPEYKALMQAFFDADVLDVELLYDNAALAVNYRQGAKFGVRHILAGTNSATEGMTMPQGWNWNKFDKKNIQAIGKRFTNTTLRTFPSIGTFDFFKLRFVNGVRWTSVLDLMPYNKAAVLKELTDKYGYKPYPYKHYESIFTRFYQGYLLPTKFGVDKRKLHLGTLVASGQMDRADALKDLDKLPYPSEAQLNEDRQYFLKKMAWTQAQLDAYLARPPVPHDAYPSEVGRWNFATRVLMGLRSLRSR
ncbi:N-acetyl sugar amidotransferase [Pelomonas aquatica]|uniref:N-acetyl sugar amidotransferase n=1 Tax=Pelomonas aquatica TaxID=431058 RepID=A0ABU1Z5U8_9BURK|nr:N-acetyl sugar amidotransferase [Pelomonas aquatica]MDR7295808.1 N-acetyl sugar amidotransferase [Pelomonas aquatica]